MNVRGIGFTLAAAAVLGTIIASVPDGQRRFSVDLWLVGVAAWAGIGLARRALGVVPAERDRLRLAIRFQGREPDEDPTLPRDLVGLEGSLLAGADNPRTYHHRVRPRIRRIVDHRLRMNRGIDAEADPARADAALDDLAWLVDVSPAMGDDGRSPTPAELTTLLDRTDSPQPRSTG